MMACINRIFITIKGKGGYSGDPEVIDPIPAGIEI